MVFLGASTAFQEISELINDINENDDRYKIVAILDDNPDLHGRQMGGVEVAGGLDLVHRYPDANFVFGIGSHRTRLQRHEILERLGLSDDRYVTLIHPAAKVYRSATVGAGCIIHAGAVIGNDTVLDPFAIVAFNSAIGPFVRIRRCAMVTTLVVVLSGADIGAGAFIGAGSCLADGIRIGPGAMIGLGTNVFRNVGTGAYVLGNPARELYRVDVPDVLMLDWGHQVDFQIKTQDVEE